MVVVERAKKGDGKPFRGYPTLEVASASDKVGERLLVPREDVEQ